MFRHGFDTNGDRPGTEVDRYISWPGQALSYYLGEMTIWRIRDKAERALGPKFNLRAFHDFVWKNGNVPIALQDWEYLAKQ